MTEERVRHPVCRQASLRAQVDGSGLGQTVVETAIEPAAFILDRIDKHWPKKWSGRAISDRDSDYLAPEK
jgi:hypothetical protein